MTPPLIVVVSRDPSVSERAAAAAGTIRVQRQEALAGTSGVPQGALWLIDTAVPALPPWQAADWGRLAQAGQFVVLTSTPSDDEGLLALEAGASGYCHAYASAQTLRSVIATIAEGHLWVGRSLMTRLLRGVSRAWGGRSAVQEWGASLTPREREVAARAASGEANLAIANALGITERTVKAHLSVVFEKLAVQDRLQLALKIHGIVP